MNQIKTVVSQFNELCKLNQFQSAGILALENKSNFIQMIKEGGNKEMLYAYQVCSIFGMRRTDCFNIVFQ